MSLFLTRTCVLSILYVGLFYCLELVPERAYFKYWNPKYFGNSSIQVRRYDRNSIYYVNARAAILTTLSDNVSLHVETYEYLHNEYKRSFVEVHGPLCRMISDNFFVKSIFRKINLTCPIYPGLLLLGNLSMNIENFPNEFPFSKGLLNISLDVTKTKEVIVVVHVFASFKQKRKKRP